MIEAQSRSLNPRGSYRFTATRMAPGKAARNHDVDAYELVVAAESSPIAHLVSAIGAPYRRVVAPCRSPLGHFAVHPE